MKKSDDIQFHIVVAEQEQAATTACATKAKERKEVKNMATKMKFLPVKDMQKLVRLLVSLNPRELKKSVEEIEEIIQRAQTIHKNADTEARQIWRRVAKNGKEKRENA